MLKSVLMATALLVAPVAAHAAEAVVAPAAAAAPAEAAASAAVEAAADAAVTAKETTLKDGTKVVIEGDMVSTLDAHGMKTPAKDGTWELADGTKVTTKGGKVVAEPKAAH